MKTFKLLVLATLLAATPACKKKPQETPPPPTTGSADTTGSGSDTAMGSGSDTATGSGSDTAMGSGSGSDSGSAAAGSGSVTETEPAEYFVIEGRHKDPNPKDPVKVEFDKFKVTKATFDPAKIEGGKATIEVDLTSLKTDSDKRDGHLKEGYLEVAKFATLVINVDNVKKKDDKMFTADAKVKLHGVEKKYPVTFEVVEAKDDWVKIKGEHKFSRTDFKIGKPVADKDESVAMDLVARLQLTLKKT